MAFDREAARAAGYSDEEIDAYLKANPEVASAPPATPTEPPPPEKVYVQPGSDSMVSPETLGMAAAAVPSVIAPAAVGAAGAYFGPKIISKGAEIIRNMRSGPVAPEGGPVANRPVGPIDPNAPRTKVPINQPPMETKPGPGANRLETPGGPRTTPINPNASAQPKIGGPAAQQGASFIESLAQKYGPMIGRAGVGIAGMVTPGNVGQNYNFPTRGPLRGSEINPNTGRPWTPQELEQYNATYQ